MLRSCVSKFAFLLALALGAAGLSRAQTPAAAAPSAVAAAPAADMAALAAEAQGWLIDLIRMDTSNPPGNEMVSARYIAGVLQKEKHFPRKSSRSRLAEAP